MKLYEHTCQRCGKECSCTHPKDFLVGAILGGIVGATAGLLLAPKSGAELRQDITDKVQEISDNTQDFASDIQEKGQKFAKKATSQATGWVEQARDVVDTISEELSDWKDRRNNGGSRFKETVESASRNIDDILDWASLGIRLWQTAKRRK